MLVNFKKVYVFSDNKKACHNINNRTIEPLKHKSSKSMFSIQQYHPSISVDILDDFQHLAHDKLEKISNYKDTLIVGLDCNKIPYHSAIANLTSTYYASLYPRNHILCLTISSKDSIDLEYYDDEYLKWQSELTNLDFLHLSF
jgi:hypothetical protein